MKTKINTDRYSNQALEDQLKQALKEIELEVIQQATDLARIDLPRPTNDNINMYFGQPHSKIQGLIDTIAFELQPRTTISSVVEHGKSTKGTIQEKVAWVSDKKSEVIKINSARSTKAQSMSYQRLIFIHILIVLVGVAEGTFVMQNFQIIGYTLFESFFLSLLYALVITLFCHQIIRIINLGPNIIWKRVIAGVLTIFVIGFFTFMANLRVQYLTDSAKSQGIAIVMTPVPFVLMSVLVLLVGIFLVYFYLPSKKEQQKISEQKELEQKENSLHNEIAREEISIRETQQEHLNLRNYQASKLEFGSQMESYLMNQAVHLFQLFKLQNQKNRQTTCECYADVYSMPFQLYFTPLLNKNEN